MTEEEKTDSANGEANACNGAQFDAEKSSAAAQAGSEAKAEEAADNPSVYAKLIESASIGKAIASMAQSASAGKALASMAQSMFPAQGIASMAQSMFPAQGIASMAQSMFPAQDIGQTLAKLFSAAVPTREQLIEKQKEYTEERRNQRKRHWAESIRSTHNNRVKVTSGKICEDLFWGKDRMTAIENARPSDLKVIELFDLADYLGIPPMLLIGETTKKEEYARKLFNSLTCEQQETCLALMKYIAGSGQTASDDPASETGI